jgi:hypothetical protein
MSVTYELVRPKMIVRFFAIPAKLAVTGPFMRAVSYGKLLIPYRNIASDFSFVIFAIADRIFNSYISGLLLELGLVLSGNRFLSTRPP